MIEAVDVNNSSRQLGGTRRQPSYGSVSPGIRLAQPGGGPLDFTFLRTPRRRTTRWPSRGSLDNNERCSDGPLFLLPNIVYRYSSLGRTDILKGVVEWVRASSVASNSENSLVGVSGYKLKKDGKKSRKVKLEKLPASAMKRQDSEMTGSNEDGASSRSCSPILPDFGDEVVVDGNDSLKTVICKHCKKSVLKQKAKEHLGACLKSKQDKARKEKEARDKAQRAKAKAEGANEEDDEDDEIKGSARIGTSPGDGADDGAKKGKKRKS